MLGRPRVDGVDLNVNTRMQCKKALEPWYEQLACEERRQPHTHIAPAVAARELCKAAIHHLQQRRDLIKQRVPGGRQRKRARLAHEQTHTHELLELLHLMADGRWSQSKLICSSFEALMSRGNAKRAQVAQRRCSG